jgi:hypothetical protein
MDADANAAGGSRNPHIRVTNEYVRGRRLLVELERTWLTRFHMGA